MNSLTRKLVTILSAVLFCCLLSSCGKTELRKRTQGYKGVARSNGFLAAQRYLTEMGYEVESKSGVGKLNDDVGTLFLPTSSLNTSGRGKRVMDWVSDGGHVVVMLGNGGKRGNDFILGYDYSELDTEDAEIADELSGVDYILSELNIKTVEWDDGDDEGLEGDEWESVLDEWESVAESERVLRNSVECSFSFGDEEFTAHQWSNKRIQYGSGDASELYVTEYYGDGLVTLLSDGSPLRNRYIGYADHAVFLEMLIDKSYHGKVIFSSGAGDGLFSLIWRYFRFAVIGLAVVIIFWLWKNLPGFGPEQDVPESQMREFSGQLRGTGRFLWRYQRDDTMLDALRGAIQRKLNVGKHDDPAVFTQLAESSSLPVEEVIEAMTHKGIRDHGVMVRVVKNLQIILKTIN